MKKNLILTGAAILALLFTSCNKEETESISTSNGNKAITLTISGANLTKSAISSTGATSWDEAAAYGNFDIYFCDAADKILYAYSINNTDNADLMAALTNKEQGVRFINLENVTAVYVVANASTAHAVGQKVTTIIEYLYNQAPYTSGAETPKTSIMYIGGDTSLDFGQEPGTPETTIDYAGGSWTEVTDYEDNQYYQANLSIRPIISRLEMNSIQALASGSYTSTYAYGDVTYDYTVTWTGFEPELKGIYMSNFYGSLTPVVPSMGDFFATPTGDKVDTDGVAGATATYLWSSAYYGTTDYITAAYNLDGITLYTSGSADANLFDGTLDADAINYVYFDQSGTACVPFNFLVPFDVTATASVIDRNTTVMPSTPRYHFLVNLDQIYLDNSYSYKLYVGGGDYDIANEFVPATEEEEVLYQLLTADFNFTAVSDGNYYANIVNLYESTDVQAIIQPNTIYKTDVTIAPYNLTTSTIYEETHNIIVIVEVVPYAIKNVTVGFDKN